jgi:Protein of unknown function (DUF3071)
VLGSAGVNRYPFPMSDKTDLRLVGRSEDGTELELTDHDGKQFALRISDHLRASVNQPRLVAVASPDQILSTSVKEIQARLRSGESADSIARTTEWELEKIERFSGPIMQERAFVIGQALETLLRRDPHSPTLMAATIAQLSPRGVDMQLVEWSTWRRDDGLWNILLTYPITSGSGEANWAFDTHNRTLVTEDDGARWISGEEKPSRPATPSHGMVYQPDGVTTPAPRLVAVKPEEPIRISTTPSTSDSPEPVRETTRAKEDVEPEAKRDGVTRRIRIPSWDDIMFGKKEEGSEPRPE